ncbi:dUTP diphosphatase [Proteinivorax tanatarense]|uniref:Deoxyuridine 5'-triphosphate nucleotidohydrolase n=1 Tax=Proteinivorax tanatarense TaxID=1260629 RepID=A0AAU7VKQ4_9FIRM
MIEVKFKKITNTAIIPKRQNTNDAGLDIYADQDIEIKPGESALISTGLSMELPYDTEAQVRPRSGLALKHSVTVLNTPGTIDSGYRGEVKVILINHGTKKFKVQKNMRIAQMVIKPVYPVKTVEVEDLSPTDRGEGGFGSTGKI